jgi:hypothetical protein
MSSALYALGLEGAGVAQLADSCQHAIVLSEDQDSMMCVEPSSAPATCSSPPIRSLSSTSSRPRRLVPSTSRSSTPIRRSDRCGGERGRRGDAPSPCNRGFLLGYTRHAGPPDPLDHAAVGRARVHDTR